LKKKNIGHAEFFIYMLYYLFSLQHKFLHNLYVSHALSLCGYSHDFFFFPIPQGVRFI